MIIGKQMMGRTEEKGPAQTRLLEHRIERMVNKQEMRMDAQDG